jgi:hypothetical protein
MSRLPGREKGCPGEDFLFSLLKSTLHGVHGSSHGATAQLLLFLYKEASVEIHKLQNKDPQKVFLDRPVQ